MKNNRVNIFFSKYKTNIALIAILGMVFGFLCARAVLSLSMFIFFINGFWGTSPREWLKEKWAIWGLSWLAVYALSFFWSSDLPYWQERIVVKLPFAMLPFAFTMLPAFTRKQLNIFTILLNIFVFSGCIYSLSFYWKDSQAVLEGYNFSKTLITPVYKDHIRFSIFVAWTALWNLYYIKHISTTLLRSSFIFFTLFFAAYLHILAVRSGLLFLYAFIATYIVYLLFSGKKKIALLSIIVFSIGLSMAFLYVPSFRAKLFYVSRSYDEYKQGNKTADFSDIGRIISYDLATKIIAEHPYCGVGAGDVREEMKMKYEQYSPSTDPEQRIVPHNQAMEVALVGGLLGLIPFLIWLFYPLYQLPKSRNGIYLFATWFGLFLCLMVEPMLEIQTGVFVFLFCYLMMKFGQKSVTSNPTIQA